MVYDIHEVPFGEKISVEEGIQFYHADDRERISKDFGACISEKKPFSDIYRILTRKGREIYVKAVGVPKLGVDGSVVSVRGVFQDVDAQHRAELLLEESLGITTQQNEKLINFAHIVSHNLRNHSSNLEMLVKFIQDSESEEDRADLLTKISEVVQNLSDPIENLNEVVSVQTKLDKAIEEVSLNKTVQKIIDICTGDLRAAKAVVDVDIPADMKVRFNQAYLDSVLLNLVCNAIRYRKDDVPLELTIQSEKLPNGDVSVSVKDNGIEIDLEAHGKRLFTLNGTLHNHPDSRGVGLYISKNQLVAIGGSINVKSEVGKGAEFTFTIPE